MVDKALLRSKIKELTEIYEKNKGRAESERDVCRVFIEPLFEALDWKVRSLDEVQEQKNQPQGRPDYIFYLNGSIAFYLEAKKFKVLDEEDIKQALNYARNKGKRWAVLSNFEETVILICDTQESSLQQHIFRRISYQNLESNIDDLLLLSKDSFKNNTIDKKAEEDGRIKKTIKIDKELLDDILKWQEMLTKSIKDNNKKEYEKEVLQEIVQILLNRIIFIRTAEDRKNEARSDETIKSILNVYEQFSNISIRNRINRLFEEYDEIYDSKLFTYEENNFKNRHECEKVEIDNKTYHKILKGTYDKNKIYSYRFDAIDADVLGSMYEKYIGSIQEYRKKQGIYYTPTWVVNYIVNNTLGSFIENGTKANIEKVKVLDMACGSGSFLLKAYDVFDEYYKSNLKKYLQSGLDLKSDATKITQRTKILKEHIFGVDLDIKAVEIAQLNLLLKIAETRYRLPDLRNNIKQGNSLIEDKDIVEENLIFNWDEQFNDKFDIIIGNPPYFDIRTLSQKEQLYFKNSERWRDVYTRQADILYYFIINAIRNLKDGGILGFITSRYWLEATDANKLRKFILDNCTILKIIDFRDLQIFEGKANIHTLIIILQKVKKKNPSFDFTLLDSSKIEKEDLGKILNSKSLPKITIKQNTLSENNWIMLPEEENKIFNRIKDNGEKLSKVFHIGTGIQTGRDGVFVVNSDIINSNKIEKESLKRWIKNGDIDRYSITDNDLYVINGRIDFDITKYKHVTNYLESHKKDLSTRYEYIKKKCNLYQWSTVRELSLFNLNKKIICPYKADENRFCLIEDEIYFSKDVYQLIKLDNIKEDYEYFLALLNSNLLEFYFKRYAKKMGSIVEFYAEPLLEMPLRRIDFNLKSDKQIYEQIIELVPKINKLSIKESKITVNDDSKQTIIRNKRALLEKLDKIICKLYGLNDKETQFVLES